MKSRITGTHEEVWRDREDLLVTPQAGSQAPDRILLVGSFYYLLSGAECTAGVPSELSSVWRVSPAFPGHRWAPALVRCGHIRLSTCGQENCAHLKYLPY